MKIIMLGAPGAGKGTQAGAGALSRNGDPGIPGADPGNAAGRILECEPAKLQY